MTLIFYFDCSSMREKVWHRRTHGMQAARARLGDRRSAGSLSACTRSVFAYEVVSEILVCCVIRFVTLRHFCDTVSRSELTCLKAIMVQML